MKLLNQFKKNRQKKEQIRLLRKQVEELKKEPQMLIDKMNIMKAENRQLKLDIKLLEKELNEKVNKN